jgi:hypothetical protein
MGSEHESAAGTARSEAGSAARLPVPGHGLSPGAEPRYGPLRGSVRAPRLLPGSVPALQRQVGNRAVTASLQRQPAPAPAPAAGAAPPARPVPPRAPTAEENAPVELPKAGPAVDVPIVFSSGRQLTFEMGDLRDFGLGEGTLETPEIPVGEFISVKAAIGSHNPITLRKPTLTLDPVIGTISAAQVAKYRADTADSASTRTTLGAVAAGAGGIGGGLAGIVWGGLAGSLGGPIGTAAGATAGARWGAEQGGLAAGRAMEMVYDFFRGDYDVTARLDQGQITGTLGLHYTPFLKLSLGATGFQWLANISAELLTTMDLTAAATIGLSGSNIVLHFRDGRLVRTVFTLAPFLRLNLDLVAQARLKLVGSVLNILEESAGREAAVLSGEYLTGQFPLFAVGGTIGAQTLFQFAKGSPMEVLGKQVTAAAGGTRERFIAGLRASGTTIPLVKNRRALDEKSRTGLSENRAILMAWHKPAQWYPDYLTRPSATGRGERIRKFPHMVYDNGLAMGVNDWPYEGKKLKYRGGDEPRGTGVARFMRELREEGIDLEGDLAYKADIDHVIDWAFSGADDETNLWPLESGANRSAGVTQNRFQKVWWAPTEGAASRRTPIEEVPTGRWFEIWTIRPPS